MHRQSSEEHNEADRSKWRQLVGSFRNVKTLRIDEGLVEELSRCLELDDGCILGVALPVMHILRSSMLARPQAAP